MKSLQKRSKILQKIFETKAMLTQALNRVHAKYALASRLIKNCRIWYASFAKANGNQVVPGED